MAQKEYMVYREVDDMGPMGSRFAYVKTTAPLPGEKIFHGNFKPVTVDCGQHDSASRTEYVPVGEPTSELFGVENF
jgi:hypothetical protein